MSSAHQQMLTAASRIAGELVRSPTASIVFREYSWVARRLVSGERHG
jgi:hypothetical protein